RTPFAAKAPMLSETELLAAALFIAGLTVMSIIEVAFANVNKVSLRRQVDGSKGKAAASIAALLDARTEALTSIHISIQMFPVSGVLMSVLNYFHRIEEQKEPAKEEEASEEEIQAFIDAGQEEGILERDEGEMIQSILQFGDIVARDVMTPRTQIVAIDINSSVEKLLQLVINKRHARIPVYRDDLDNVEGIVHERDLLRVWQRGDKLDNFRSLIKPAYFVPETT